MPLFLKCQHPVIKQKEIKLDRFFEYFDLKSNEHWKNVGLYELRFKAPTDLQEEGQDNSRSMVNI